MIIYGTALLALCHLLGIFLGDLLGTLVGVKTNVGGVGIAMMLLIFARMYMEPRGLLPKPSEAGVTFWAALYIPVVVAMALQQNVVAALRGGHVAILAAIGAAFSTALIIAAINRTEPKSDADPFASIDDTLNESL